MEGSSVLITGGGGGMGRAFAAAFSRKGATVAVCDISAAGLEGTLAAVGDGRCFAVRADLSVVAECERAVKEVIERTGRLDVLVNAAGLWVEGPAVDATEQEWDRVMAVNLKAPYFMSKYAIPELGRTQGCIVNISSDAGVMGERAAAIYSASKGGLNLLTKSLALELAPRGVRVNAVCPCDVATPMIEFQANTYGAGDPAAYKQALLASYPQGASARFATAEEIAGLVLFLASREAAPMTGACVSIDFGRTSGR